MTAPSSDIRIDASNPDKAIRIADRIWWVGHYLPDDPFQCHVYLIENGDQSVLIDPGSKLTFKHCLRKIEEVVPLRDIRYFICHHQDPDITGALPLLDQLVSREDAVIISHWRAIALLKHYGLDLNFWCVEEHGWKLDLGGRELEFVFTPYLHFPGAFCTFDRSSGTLFSSDLFGGFTEGWQLVAEDESYFESIRPFHEHYMPSRDILFNGLTRLEEYPARLIAPQHGSIIPKDLIPFIFGRLKSLECGLYLMTQTSTDIARLTKLNEILRNFMASMITYKSFKEIADECLNQLRRIIPASSLTFYTPAMERDVICLQSESLFKGEACSLPDRFAGLIGVSLGHWREKFGNYVYHYRRPAPGEEEAANLAIPLLDPEEQKVSSIAVIRLSEDIEIDRESIEVIRKISLPLSVAVERELITRSLETERQKFYEQSIRDPLTNLYTRVYMRESVSRLFSLHDRDPKASVGILAFDIDHFKSVNDTYGHNAGDQVIKAVADILFEETRSGDIQVRLGGEEFTVFMVSSEPEVIVEVAKRVRRKVESLKIEGPMSERRFTISSGVVIRRQGEELQEAIHRADQALYEAKNTGRNKVCARI